MKEIKNLILVLIGAVFFIGMYFLCDSYAQDITDEYSSQISPSLITGETTDETSDGSNADELGVEGMVQGMVQEGYSKSLSITAAGDIFCQSGILEKVYNYETESFDFSSSFSEVTELLSSSDLTLATLKTTMAGAYNGYATDYAGYGTDENLSNSPSILADSIAASGIDIINMANNHSMDSGESGLVTTMDNLKSAGLSYVGTAISENDLNYYQQTVSGFNIAILGMTNGVNNSYDETKSYLINDLDNYSQERISKICTQISSLSSTNDFIIIMINFGSVNDDSIDNDQRSLAEQLVESGADIIIGTGSRAMKPMELITVTDFNGKIHNGLVFYGMGALMTSETYSSDSGISCDLSAIITFNIESGGMGDGVVGSFDITPVYLVQKDNAVVPVPICEGIDNGSYATTYSEEEMSRMNEGYNSVVTHLLENSGLTAVYKEFKYNVTIQ